MEVLLAIKVWTPPDVLLRILLVIGACLTASIAMLVLSFYEDFYWNDEEFRKSLRWTASQRKGKI